MNRLLLAGCLLLMALPVQAEWNVEETLAAQPGDRLEVDLQTGGSIQVEGWSRDEVKVTATVKQGTTAEVEFDIAETDYGVAVHSRLNSRGKISSTIEVVIMVPQRFDLDLDTMGGSIQLSNLEGRIVGETMGGGLKLDRLKGSLRLSTMGGEIKLSDSDVDGRVKTLGGDVFLSGVAGNVEATTMGGDVIYDRVEPGPAQRACKVVKIDTMGGNIEVVIMVPHRFDLDLDTLGGSIQLTNLEGRIVGETMGGELTLDRLKGSLRLSTMGGEIRLTDSDVDGRVKTMGGDVFLSGVIGDVEATTMGGDVIYDRVEPGKDQRACKVMKIDTMGGDIEALRAPCGAILDTMGGSIKVDQAAEFVKADTLGGNITIGAVDGWVRATTMGGEISVRMTGDPGTGRRDVRLVSMDGDISLSVPDGLSMMIDISLAYTKKSQQDFKIDSEFPLDLRTSDNWEYGHGSPRKYIRGTGTTGEGDHKIKIETINGNVTLKKTR
jgi:DUF4097 and DUF4098 domain-containing protein YvlB